MSCKLAAVLKAPLAAIRALSNDTQLDASSFDLDVCERLLSTHSGSSWTILNPIRAQQSKLINADLVENTELGGGLVVEIEPHLITSGMLITQHGYVGRVVKVDRYERNDEWTKDNNPYVYCIRMEYVGGDLSMHEYFTARINNGCDQGHLSTLQGNALAKFFRVLED